ncbi:MAG: energy-coupling factor transporter transmembrane protein EcfT [Mycobacterium sp.]|nr:energy-coupling factor transporter transmembrane protein EcfT [Mycobacterium sp.]
MTATVPPHKPVRRPLVLMRPVPVASPIHSLWAGTKLIVIFGVGLVLATNPGWVPIAAEGGLVMVGIWLANIPRSALPSVPVAVWVVLVLGSAFLTTSGGAPFVDLGSVHIGLGGVLQFLRITMLTIVLLSLGALLSWTTELSDIAPALAKLGRPLRWLRIPVDDWATTMSLALRSFPMMFDEFRLVQAARKLRPNPRFRTRRQRCLYRVRDFIDLVSTAIAMMLRRADEMGDAITARGGAGQITASRSGPGRVDWAALSIVALVCAAALAVQFAVGGASGPPMPPPGFGGPPPGAPGFGAPPFPPP